MTINWPAQLPPALSAAYSVSPNDAVIRTEMESGTARQRQRYTSVPTEIKVSWIMTKAQFQIFQAWWVHKANGGALWVSMVLPNGTETVRFLKPYSATAVAGGRDWNVSGSVEARDFTVLSEDDLDMLLEGHDNA